MDDLDEQVCPLCCEELDLSDQNFLPCKCGYQVCMWCWHHIKENLNGLCPACRTPYQDDPHAFSAVDRNEIIKNKKERKQKEKEKERKEQLAAAAAAAAARSKVSHATLHAAFKACATQPPTGPQQHQQQLQQQPVQQQQHQQQHQPPPQVQQRLARAAARPVIQPSTLSPPVGIVQPSPAHLEKSSPPATEPYQRYDEPLNGTLRGQPLVADASPFAPRGSNLSGLDAAELSDRRRRTQAPQRPAVTSPPTWDVVTRQQPTRPRKKAVPLFLASDSWGSTDDLTSSIWSVSYVSPRDSWGSWAAARPTRADDPLFDSSAMAAAAATSVLNDESNDSHTATRRVATNGLQSVGLGDENPLLRPKPVAYGSSFWLHPGTDDSVWGAPPPRGTYL